MAQKKTEQLIGISQVCSIGEYSILYISILRYIAKIVSEKCNYGVDELNNIYF